MCSKPRGSGLLKKQEIGEDHALRRDYERGQDHALRRDSERGCGARRGHLREGNRFRTVTFRLTMRFVLLFAGVSLAVLAISDAALHAYLRQRTYEDMEEDVNELDALYRARGIQALQADFTREAEASGNASVFLVLLGKDGEVRAASDLGAWGGVRLPPEGLGDLEAGEHGFKTFTLAGHEFDTRLICKRMEDGELFCIGHSTEEEAELREIAFGVLAGALAIMLVAGGGLGWWVARRAMGGVSRVTQTAIHIGRGSLVERVVVGDEGEEIECLGLAFNDMLDRIDALVTELREVSNNIAHDLRSPITRLRGMAETTLTAPSSLDDYRDMAAAFIDESDRLMGLINTMLDIAETDSGAAVVRRAPVDVAGLVRDAHELFEPAARESGLALELAVSEGPLIVDGDADLLRRVVANLLDNAIKYTPAGGTIRLAAARGDGRAVISVVDTGEGIEAKDLAHIFKRFYRGDSSRSRPGHGLGLSLCQAIVRAHGGEIGVRSVRGAGAMFEVRLPVA